MKLDMTWGMPLINTVVRQLRGSGGSWVGFINLVSGGAGLRAPRPAFATDMIIPFNGISAQNPAAFASMERLNLEGLDYYLLLRQPGSLCKKPWARPVTPNGHGEERTRALRTP
ncbi:uncharacterized protein CIMG_01863 [Coccidioides immitis RS]|uniref:Uncharacterized protein n=3 Tax=Coccidioides immitis TaxID=5501 RepID=J3KK41_COCIM|nr:uncharacterized protein CIMG_01863 [Coccidioides immitis RS]EAS36509.3 hypothetical protein CIMG_01863 [Coccidioides immitis RS]KMP01869.1 hypothetical protein CIRG_02008 [Coccidioides immitis RMSCC 2394]KMU79098.1 hypothetical protein CISG_07264 [Coccidioides immitis RMSCC 3703]